MCIRDRELKERVARIQAELSKAQEATVNAEKFMNIVRKHMNFEELTHTLLREFVEKIVVHECSYDENGTRRQDIEIYYSCLLYTSPFHRCSGEQRAEHAAAIAILVEQASISANQSRRRGV